MDKEKSNDIYVGKEIKPTTVGELREFLLPFDDECPLMGLNYGAFRYVLNEKGEGLIQFA